MTDPIPQAPNGSAAPAPSGYQQPPTSGPGYEARAPRSAPGFTGVPARDYVIDGLAALALLVSLTLPWNAMQSATDRIEVVLLTVLSLLSLSVHYLYRAGVFPATWSGSTVALIRALVTMPYVIMVGVTVLLDLVSAFAPGITPGVGGAAVLGLAGAVLAGLPRRAELAAHFAHAFLVRLRLTFRALAIVAATLQVVGLVAIFVAVGVQGVELWPVVWLVVEALGLAAVVGGVLFAVARGRDAWRPVVIVGGVVVLVWTVATTSQWYSFYHGSLAVVLLPATAALATAPVPWTTGPDRRRYGVAAATASLLSAALIAGLSVLLRIITGIGGWSFVPKGPLITVLILGLFIVVAAVVGMSSLQQGPAASRATAWVAVGIVAVLGLVTLAVAGASSSLSTTWLDGLVALGLPALVVWALLLPASGRTFTGVFATASAPPPRYATSYPSSPAPSTARPAPYPTGPGAPVSALQAPPPVPAPPAHGFLPAHAADPNADPAVLARIAAEAPELRPYLAANPATYPALLGWLASLHDPAVDAALATRAQH